MTTYTSTRIFTRHAQLLPRVIIFYLSTILICCNLYAQQTINTNAYPKTMGYFSVVHTLVTFDKNGTNYNFNNSYTVGFPVGITILVSDRIGYSVEVTPFVKAAGGSSKTSNVLFHPGLLFRYPHGFTFTTRLAFETSGRYGCTAIFSKVVVRSKLNNYFVAVPLPFRFGNDLPASAGIGFQLGVTF